MKAFRFAIGLGTAVVVASACRGGGGSGGTYGGSITAVNVSGAGAASADAFFVSDVQGGSISAEDPNAVIPLGACVYDPPPATVPTNLAFTYVDAGPTLVLGGPAAVTLDQFVVGSAYTYSFNGNPTSIPEGTYDVAIAGNGPIGPETWSGAFRMPGPPQISAPTGFPGQVQFSGAVDLEFHWTPAGGHAVLVSFLGSDGHTLTCRGADSGTFSVKSADLAKITPTGALLFESYSFGTHPFQGRDVTLSGTTGIFGFYLKT